MKKIFNVDSHRVVNFCGPQNQMSEIQSWYTRYQYKCQQKYTSTGYTLSDEPFYYTKLFYMRISVLLCSKHFTLLARMCAHIR